MNGKKNDYFDSSLLKKFRKVVNSSNIFSNSPKYRHFWNLICVIMDRLDSAVNFLNEHIKKPKTEEEFVSFLVYAAILKDGVYKFYTNIYKQEPITADKKKWFIGAHSYTDLLFDETNCPTDDDFFNYIRALAFAHPFEVSKKGRPFINKGEIQCSPWVICNCFAGFFEKDSVGLRVYSSDYDGLKDIYISFDDLKKYLKERYMLVKEFIKWGESAIRIQNAEWAIKKVDRAGSEIQILKNICKILDERFFPHYSIDDAIRLLESSFENKTNGAALEYVKGKIRQAVLPICDSVDNLDNEAAEERLHFLYERPENLHKHAHYELEKIFDYLDDERGACLPGSDEEWGLRQAMLFYNSFAKRFVTIDFETMSYSDIKILIRLSLIIGKDVERSEFQ